jgi:polysaccharide export outer membrane protein
MNVMRLTKHLNSTACLIRLLPLLAIAISAQERPATPQTLSTFGVAGGFGSSSGFGSGAAVAIGAGDLLEMSVFDTPELSGKLRVSNTGDIFLPLVGSVHVQRMKADEAQALIRKLYIDGGFLKDPQVTLFIAEYATQGVSVMGEVKNPGIYPAFGSHHLLDYLSVAQGLTPMAGTRVTITHTGHPEEPEHVKMAAGAAPQPVNNPEIMPGDTIFVERTGLIYVVGDVARPGGFPMDHDEQLTILQAVALAQGTLPTAAKSSAKLIRTTPEGRREIPVNLKSILQSKTIDLAMQDNDILFVPSSAAKNAWKDVESVIPAAAAASIYRVP